MGLPIGMNINFGDSVTKSYQIQLEMFIKYNAINY